MIFAGLICLQNRNLKALIRYAFRGPDQVDVWDQVHLYALWNEQTGNSELLKPPLVREGRRFFLRDSNEPCVARMTGGSVFASLPWENKAP